MALRVKVPFHTVLTITINNYATHTRTRTHTCSPLMSLDTTIHISVRQKSRFSEELIGHITVPLATFTVSSKPTTHWYKLGARPGKVNKKLRGDILISIAFLSKWTTPEVETHKYTTGFAPGGSTNRVAILRSAMLKRSKSDLKLKQKDMNGFADKQNNSRVKEKISAFRRSFRKKRNSQMFDDGNDDFATFSLTPPDSLSPTGTPDLKRWSQSFDARPRRDRSYSLPHSNGGKLRSSSEGTNAESSLSPPLRPSVQALFAEAAALESGTGILSGSVVGGEGEEEGSEGEGVCSPPPPHSDSKPSVSVCVCVCVCVCVVMMWFAVVILGGQLLFEIYFLGGKLS